MDIQQVQKKLAKFAAARDWDRFHSPKNLCMALVGEVGELTEHFQWITEAQSKQLDAARKAAVAEEIADVLIYTIRLSDTLGIDIERAVRRKIRINARKYPVALAKRNGLGGPARPGVRSPAQQRMSPAPKRSERAAKPARAG